MKASALKQGLNIFNLLFVATFIVLALYSAIGQQIIPYIGQYKQQLEEYLGEQLDGEVSIRNLKGAMDILTPSVHFEGITLHTPDRPDQAKVSIAAIDAVLDPRLSLINFTPVFKSVRLSGLYVHLDEQTGQTKKSLEDDDVLLIKQVVETLLLQHQVELNNVTIEKQRGKDTSRLFLKHLTMTGDGFHHLITGNVSYGDKHKVNAGIRLYSEGSPFKLENFYARGALDLPDVDVDYWLDEILDTSFFEAFSISAQLRFEFKQGLLNYAKLTAVTPDLKIHNGKQFEAVKTELWAKQKAFNNWSFWLNDAQFKHEGSNWSFNDLGLSVAKLDLGSRWQGYIKDMNLTYLQSFLNTLDVVPEGVQSLLTDLEPSGQIKNMNIILQPNEQQSLSFTAASELIGVNSKARGGIPSVKNLNGMLAINNKSGRVQFKGEDTLIGFPTVYDKAFEFSKASGQVDWEVTDHGFHLQGEGLSLSMENTQNIRGGFQTWFYNDETLEDKLELNLSLDHADIQAHYDLVPKLVSQNLRNWLDAALKDGHAQTGSFYMLTGLNKESISQTELSLSIIDGQLSYLEEWPEVKQASGHLFVQNDQVKASLDQAATLGGQANKTQIVFDGIQSNRLWINADIEGQSSEGLAYFQNTPLKNVIGDIAHSWQATGKHKTQLGLMVPLSQTDNLGIEVNTQIDKTSLSITDIGLSFDNASGLVYYHGSKGLFSERLSAELWQETIDLEITSDVHEKGFSSDIGFSGTAKVESLQQWLNLSLLKPLSGNTHVDGHFKVSGQENGFTGLLLESNLKGVKIDLPAPYHKASEELTPFKLSLALDDGQKLRIDYDEKVNVALHLQQGKLLSGQVYLGSTEAFIPEEPGLEVFGHIPYIHLKKWEALWNDIKPQGASSTSEDSIFRRAQISTDSLWLDDFEIKQIKSDIRYADATYSFNVDSPLIKGDLAYLNDQSFDLNLQYIHWPALESDERSGESRDALKDFSFNDVPNIKFSVDEIFVGATNYGAWKGSLVSENARLVLSNIKGDIKKMAVEGEIIWDKSADQLGEQTFLKLILSSKDVGGIQKAWRTKPVLEAKDAKVNIDLNWQSTPLDIKTEQLNGKIDLSLKDGRFTEAGDAEGFSAFGILNFAAIGRRLRLDFSDVYQSGFHFDSVTGKTVLKDGLLTIVDTIDVKGPSAKFAASGSVNLNTKALNQELSVTFPITSTLPFVAILAGFAPPVAASLFVGEQLVGDQIEKFTSATYRLTGSWDEPNLKLMKRFDNEIEGKQDKGFWYRMKDFFGLGED